MVAEPPDPARRVAPAACSLYLVDRHRRAVAPRIRGEARDIGVAKTPRMAKIACGRRLATRPGRPSSVRMQVKDDTATRSLLADRRLDRPPTGLGGRPGAGQRRGVPLPLHRPPRLELFRSSADAGGRRDAGDGDGGGLVVDVRPAAGLHRPVRRLDVADGGADVAVLRPSRGLPRGLRAERVGVLHRGGRHVRPPRRAAALLLAPDARPAGRRPRIAERSSGPGSRWAWPGAARC